MNHLDILCQRIHQGDAEALGQFIELHRPQLSAYLDRELGSALRAKVEVEDLLQELAADAVRRVADANVPADAVFSWLCQIGKQRLIDLHRRFSAKKRAASKEVALDRGGDDDGGIIDLLVSSVTSPSRVLSRNDKEVRMLDALSQLPEDQQRALNLFYIQNWPTKRIAEELGKSDAAVRVMLTRSREKLKELMRS